MPADRRSPATESATLSTETKTGMRTASRKAAPAKAVPEPDALIAAMIQVIDDAKAEDIISLDLAGKTSLADAMIVASGRSDRHVGAIAERIASTLREMGHPAPRIEGMPVCDWVLIDTGDIIIHLFRPEVRGFYNLEKLWGAGRPSETPQPEPVVAAKPATPRRAPAIKAESASKPARVRKKPATDTL